MPNNIFRYILKTSGWHQLFLFLLTVGVFLLEEIFAHDLLDLRKINRCFLEQLDDLTFLLLGGLKACNGAANLQIRDAVTAQFLRQFFDLGLVGIDR
jgi:hypothetical protein